MPKNKNKANKQTKNYARLRPIPVQDQTHPESEQREQLSFLPLVTLSITSAVILSRFPSTFWLQNYIYSFSLTTYFSRQPKAQRWSHLPKNIQSVNFKNPKLNSSVQEVSIHCRNAHTPRDAKNPSPLNSQDPFPKSVVNCLFSLWFSRSI